MGTIYRRTNPFLATVSTARFILVLTTNVSSITLTSGSQAMTIFNHGSGSLIWGGTNIAINSGNYLFTNERVEWTNLQDQWTTYVLADSLNALLSVTEYGI